MHFIFGINYELFVLVAMMLL